MDIVVTSCWRLRRGRLGGALVALCCAATTRAARSCWPIPCRVQESLREQERALAYWSATGSSAARRRPATSSPTCASGWRGSTRRRRRSAIFDPGGSLQQILTNKQARGAFGEVQLNDLVTNALPPSAYELQYTLTTGARVDCLVEAAQPAGLDRDRRQVPAREL